jgi:transposase
VHDVQRLLTVLAKIGPADLLHILYEAGPTGFGLQRALTARGYTCEVIAPSKTPRRTGGRLKTDARDSLQLAQYSRSGELQTVWIPDPNDEAIRDLARAREDAVNSRTQARHQLKAFLLRHGRRYGGKTAWRGAHHRWLAGLSFEGAATQTAFTEYWNAVKSVGERVARLTEALLSSITGWRFEPVVNALQAMRGIAAITAIGLMAEIGDLSRFDHPRKLMGYLGLVPSEHSSGERTTRGSITKDRQRPRPPATDRSDLDLSLQGPGGQGHLCQARGAVRHVRTLAWKAQLRLTKRFAALHARGVQINKVAVARELAGFVWAVGTQAQRESATTA